MSQLPRYESYKDSGVQWLGEIPSHWDVKQLKFAVTCNDEALGENTEPDYEILYVDISNVSLTEGIKHKEELLFENSPSRARRVVKSGDVLVSTVRTYLKAITYVESAEENLIASTGFAVLRPSKKFDSKFIGYWIQSEGMVGNIVANSVGVSYPAINSTDLVRLPIVELPLSEQKIIADFLDKRLAQVDALISKQETLLEKLAEQRVALISHAVTKGLNPDVEIKESDVEWLGNIPKHWDTKKLKFSVGCNLKTLTDKTDSDYEILYVDISNVSLTAGIKNKEELLFENAPSRARRVVKSGDVLVSTVRTYLKAITYVESAEDNLIASTGFAVLSPLDILDSKFLGYWIQSEGMIGSIVANSVGVSYPAINSSVLVSLPIVDIPLEEQKAISSYLDMEIETINRQVKLVNSSIEKLKEYRSTLITQVVTGKIDVRNLKVN